MRHTAWMTFLLSALLLAQGMGGISARAQAELIPVAAGGLPTVHGIPLPANAEPFLAVNLTGENLQALAPKAKELGKSDSIRAVVYHVQAVVAPDEAARFYRDAMGAVPRASVGTGTPAADDGTRVLQLVRPTRTLAVRAEEQTGPTRITVAMYQGSAAPGVVLRAVDVLRTGRDDPWPADLPVLLTRETLASESQFSGPGLEILKQNLPPSAAPEPVIDVMRSLLSQARGLHHKVYRVPRVVRASELLTVSAQEADREGWHLSSVEAVTSDAMTALYVQPRTRGMVLWRAGRGGAKNISPLGSAAPLLTATTVVNRLEVTGPIDLQALFRPTTPRPAPALPRPFIVPAPRRGVSPAPPAGPFSSQRKN